MRRNLISCFTAMAFATSLSGCAGMMESKLDKDADALRTALSGEPVTITKHDDTVTITSSADRLYPSGGWELRPDAPVLSKMVPTLSQLQHTKIIVGGYTDNTPVGPQLQRMGIANNLDLSTKRAATVATFLQAHGVNPNLLSAQGFGDTHPVAPNDTPEGQAKNRRVEITLVGDGT